MPHTGRAQIGPGDQDDGAEHHADLGGSRGQSVAAEIAFPQVHDRRQKVDEEAHARRPCRGNVIVEDALHLAHGLLGGSNEQSLIGAEGQQREGKHDKSYKYIFHCEFKKASIQLVH